MKELKRRIGLGGVIAISISAMLGSGIFVLPGIAVMSTGPSIWLAYLLSAICVLPAALSKAELATAMPTSGGTYVYLNRTFGPVIGTVAGLGLCLSLLLKSSFALVGFGAYLGELTHHPLRIVSLILLAVIVVINILGVGKVSKALGLVVTTSLIGLFILSISGFMKVDPENLTPFLSKGFGGLMSTTALVFVSFAGVTKVAAIAEEIKDPEVNLPRGILWSLLIVTVIYCGVNFVLVGNIPQSDIEGNLRPIFTLAEHLGGPVVGVVAAVLGILTMASMANAGLLAASRFPFAMSRDLLLPKFLGQLSGRFLTPLWSIVVSAAVIAVSVLVLEVDRIVKLASAFMLMIYMSENLAVIVLREARVQWYKPGYRSPFYPWIQIFGIISGILLLSSMVLVVPLAIVSIGVPGLLLYVLYSRKRTNVKGVVGIRGPRRDLVEPHLEGEEAFCQLEELDFHGDATVVTTLFGREKSPEVLIEMATALCTGGRLEVVHVTEVPEQTILADMASETPQIRALRRRILAMSQNYNLDIEFDPVVSHDIYKTINDITQRLHCRWLVKEWRGKSRGSITIHNPIGWLKDHLTCHLATFRDAGVRYFKKIMVVIREDENDSLVIETANHLARVFNAEVTLVKAYKEKLSEKEYMKEKHELMNLAQQFTENTKTQILYGDSITEALISNTIEFDLVVCEAVKNENKWKRLLGTPQDTFIEKAACSVLSVLPSGSKSYVL